MLGSAALLSLIHIYYVQGGHDEKAHGHADGVHRRLGEAPGQKRCFQNGGDGRLAQPPDGQRCQRDAELAGRQVGVDVRGHVAGGLGAAALLPDGVQEEDLAGRRDLRRLNTFTIDGRTAKDFDDAVSIEDIPARSRGEPSVT